MSNFTIDRNSPLFGRPIPYHSSEFEVEMFDEASCARTRCCKLCVAPNFYTKLLCCFPASAVDVIFFTDEPLWKLADDFLNTWYDRLLLCFAFISNWVTNFSVGFCCVMFMPTVAVLGVSPASGGLGLQLNTTHQYKIWNACFVANFSLLQQRLILLRSANNTRSNRKNKKGARVFFWNTVYNSTSGSQPLCIAHEQRMMSRSRKVIVSMELVWVRSRGRHCHAGVSSR